MSGGNTCSVDGCDNNSAKDEKHFYQFPKVQPLKDIWTKFTRRGSDFEVTWASCICQDHFEPSCFITKNKKQCLKSNSIPKIFNRQTTGGVERIALTYDSDLQQYVGDGMLHKMFLDKEKRETELIEKRQRKLQEIAKLCRFCFDAHDELVDVRKLKISISEVLKFLGIDSQLKETLSSVVCTECFQHIISIDEFRKRCKEAQNRIVSDLSELDENIRKVGFKTEPAWGSDGMRNSENLLELPLVTIKKEEETSDGEESQFDVEVPAKIELEDYNFKSEAGTSEILEESSSVTCQPPHLRTFKCFFCHVVSKEKFHSPDFTLKLLSALRWSSSVQIPRLPGENSDVRCRRLRRDFHKAQRV